MLDNNKCLERNLLEHFMNHFGKINSMRLAWVVLPLIVLGIIGILESSAQEPEISIDVIGGILNDFNWDKQRGTMNIKTAMENDGKIILNIPKTVWHMADSDCNPTSPLILVHGAETPFEETITEHERIIEIDLSGGGHDIEIISNFVMMYAGDQAYGKFCAELENGNYLPPKKQMALGFGFHQVICKGGLVLTTKSSNISPACVKPESIPKLVERGWTKNVILQKTIKVSNSDVILRYNIENAELVEIYTDHATGVQIFNLKNSQNGHIVVEFPKLNENCSHNEAEWFVLINGVETDYVMIDRHNSIIFSIHFPENTSEIELIGTLMIHGMLTGCSIIN